MNWQEIRNHYPDTWLLVEAIKARSEKGKRILEQMAVINSFKDSISAMNHYKLFKKKEPDRELFVFHTSKATLDVTERRWLGLRGVHGLWI